jgi:hypothetical protein
VAVDDEDIEMDEVSFLYVGYVGLFACSTNWTNVTQLIGPESNPIDGIACMASFLPQSGN